jgi:hypothetical protein
MTEPCLILPDAILDDGVLRHLLDIHPDQIARARRSGELKYSRRGGRFFYVGQWVLDWLAGGVDQVAPGERQEAECQAVGQ